MNHIIVRERASEIRAIARGALKGNWPMVIAALAVYYVMTTVVANILALALPEASYTVYNELLESNFTVSYVGNLYDFLLSGAFNLGLCFFLLSFFRMKDTNPMHIFDGFEYFIKSLGLMIMQSIFIFLWSLLLIVPGIIAALRYSQAYFVLADHPEKGIMECISDSKFIMAGNKGRYFCTMLSFIGWWLLAAVVTAFLPAATGIFGVILSAVFNIPSIIVSAYSSTAEVVFYDLATGHLTPRQPEFAEEDYHF